MKTIFERIIESELPCDKVYENENVIAFKDIFPKAAIHILIVTKKPIPDFQSIKPGELFLLGEIGKAAQWIAKKYGLEKEGYRLVTNNGRNAGQEVFHLHFHLLAGEPLGGMCV